MLNNIVITDITKTKQGYNALFSEDGFMFSVDDVIISQNKIEIGSCFTTQELSLIYKKSNTNKAVNTAYNLLSMRAHSRKELYTKLCRKFDNSSAEFACDKLEEMGLVNDIEFCRQKADYLINVKKYSLRETRLKLLTLGINRDIIENCIEDNYCTHIQAENISHLLKTKYKSKLGNPQKVIASLMRKGFSYYDIVNALKEIEIYEKDEY